MGKIYTQLTQNLPETYRNLPDHLAQAVQTVADQTPCEATCSL